MAFKSKTTANIGTSGSPSTVSASVASATSHTIIGFSISNTSAAAITASAKLNKSGGDSAFLVKDATILPGGALIVVGAEQKQVLETSDTITAYASAGSSADAIVSYLV